MPVVVLFWAEQVAPSAQTRQQLESLVAPYAPKLVLGLVDVSKDQSLAQHLRVQGLPSVRVLHGGQIVEQLDGPQPESQYKSLFERLTVSPADALRGQLEELLAAGDYDRALKLLQAAVNEEPNNAAFRVELADLLVLRGEFDDARQALGSIPTESEGITRPRTRLEIAEEAAELVRIAVLACVRSSAACVLWDTHPVIWMPYSLATNTRITLPGWLPWHINTLFPCLPPMAR